MSIRDYAVSVLASLSEKKMREFVLLFGDDNTIALMESEINAHDPNRKFYDNFDEILEEVENEQNYQR